MHSYPPPNATSKDVRQKRTDLITIKERLLNYHQLKFILEYHHDLETGP